MASRKGIRLLSFKYLFKEHESNSETFGDNVAHTKDINKVTFQKRSVCTGQRIGLVIFVCLLIAAGVVVAVYFATKASDDKDRLSEKGNLSVTNTMPPSMSPTTKKQTSPSSTTTETASSTTTTKPPITTESSYSTATTMTTNARTTTEVTSTTTTQSTTTEDTSIGLDQWGEWTTCTVTCGSGIHKRYRDCSSEAQTCSGDFVETRVCEKKKCPVHGVWTTWSSWGSCDVTCGGGKQIRSRSCKKENEQDFDCVGRQSQNQSCNAFGCPDCDRECTVGTLNEACDACICESAVTSGRVVSAKTGNPISGASIYDADAPQRMLTNSNSTGFFTLNNTCTTTKLLVTREGFVNKEFEDIGTYVEIHLDKLVLPHFTETPESKNRLVGENVTLCCTAKANPAINSYEWFKDGILLDETFLPNSTSLTLINVSVQDSGKYQCRANSLSYSAIMSPTATLKVLESSNEFCSGALKEKIISLPDDCIQPLTKTPTYKVRECIKTTCRQNGSTSDGSCRDEVESCCTPFTSQLKTVNCSGYQIEVLDVTSCGCRACGSNIITLAGNVKGKDTMLPIARAEVWLNGEYKTSTSYKGTFNIRFSKITDKIVINVKDTRDRYLEAIKNINIKSNLAGTLSVNIYLLKANAPVDIDSTVPNTVKAGSLVDKDSVPRLELSIPANSYYLPNGTIYNGTVCACLTFIDPASVTDAEDTPGNFQFIDTMGETQALDTLGVFNVFFEDSSGNDIVIKDRIDVNIPSDLGDNESSTEFGLWTLSAETGIWVLDATTGDNGRKKRGSEKTSGWIGEIDWSTITKRDWKNIDRVRKNERVCFFKLKLYSDYKCTEEIETRIRYINVNIHMITGSVFNSDLVYVQNTATECVPTVCRKNIRGSSAYISAYYYKRPSGIKALYAATPVVQSELNYTIAESDQNKTLKIKMSRTKSGPFFEDESKCQADPKYYLRYYDKTDFQLSEFTSLKYATAQENSTIKEALSGEQMAWYTKDPKHFKMCKIKVRIEQSVSTQNENISFTLRAISSGGTIPVTEGKIFGIRDRQVDVGGGKQNFCLEYKCSGEVPTAHDGQSFTKFSTDYVNITVIPMLSHWAGWCYIDFTSQTLLKESPPDNSQYQRYADKFQIFAPTGFSFDHGLYSKPICEGDECTDDDENEASVNLTKDCLAGEEDDDDDNPEDIAVSFHCNIR